MKKILVTVIVLLSIIVIPSCKKGEDDPFISLRSRDARVTAKWKLVNYEYQYTSSGGFGSTSVLNGSILTVSSGGSTNSYSYSKELEINSDGTYTITEIEDGDIYTSKSVWHWLNNTDDKTSISLYNDGNYVIDRLSSKELILRKESVSSETNNGTSYSSSSKSLLTFEKQ